jgi:hypothetical protein
MIYVLNTGIELMKKIPGIGKVFDQDKPDKPVGIGVTIKEIADRAEQERRDLRDILDRVRRNDRGGRR